MLLETPKEADLLDDRRNLATLCGLVADAERVRRVGLRTEQQSMMISQCARC